MRSLYSDMFPLYAVLVTFMLASCASTTPVQIETKPVQLTVIQPPPPAPLSLSDVKVSVVTAENIDEFILAASKEQGTDNPVFVVVSVQGYENLSLNIAELKRYILQQQEIIAYYRKATTKTN